MAHASLRKVLVALYTCTQTTDDESGITVNVYTREIAPNAGGLWWATRGTLVGKETAPGNAPQGEAIAYFSLDSNVVINADSLIAEGIVVDDVFIAGRIYRVHSIMPRDYYRDQIQAVVTHVDKADDSYVLTDPIP